VTSEREEALRERDRILAENQRRRIQNPSDLYSISRPDVLARYQSRTRAVIKALRANAQFPLSDKRVLEVGVGSGQWLADFESWGALRGNLAGIDIDAESVSAAAGRLGPALRYDGSELSPGADIRTGDASGLPWADAAFDIAIQSTVFTSILSSLVRERVAREMARVVKNEGIILWYDFTFNNPRNPSVAGISRSEIRRLFPGFTISFARITLAPPVARILTPVSPRAADILESFKILNTHLLAVIRKRE
jgi:ubiquinone/menaquinone biosynthesis C-methylase UbiE